MIIPKEVKDKPFEYLLLLFIFTFSFIAYFFIPSNQLRRWIIAFIALLYFCWSLYHHHKRGDLQLSIVIEYLLVILIGIIIISTTLL